MNLIEKSVALSRKSKCTALKLMTIEVRKSIIAIKYCDANMHCIRNSRF